MTTNFTNLSVEQLREQLKKSEAGRAKLRESLGLLREKALNTGELLRQHRGLQEKFQFTQEELGKEKAAREEAAQAVQSAKQAATLTTKTNKALEEQLRGYKTQAKAAKRATVDAAAAIAMAEAAQAAVAPLRQQVAEMQRRLQQPNAVQQSGSTTSPAAASVSELRSEVQRLRAEVAALQGAWRDGPGASADVQALRHEVAEQQGQLQHMISEMARWRSAMGVLAGVSPAHQAAPRADPWVAASPSEIMHDVSVREGSNLLPSGAAVPRIGSTAPAAAGRAVAGRAACGAAAAAEAGRLHGEPSIAASELAAHGSSDEGLSGDRRRRRAGTAAAAAGGAHQAAASGNGLDAGGERRQRVLTTVALRTKRRRLGGDDVEAASNAGAQLSEDTEGSLAGGENGDTAADVVQLALGRLTRGSEAPSRQAADEVAAALHDAIREGAVPLASVAAGFETALLECAAPPLRLGRHSGDGTDDALHNGVLEAAVGVVSVLGLQLLPVWCASGARWPRTLALVLHCATKLSARLQAAAGEALPEAKRAAELRQGPFLASLRAHLHRGATAQGGRLGGQHPRYYETEACAISAATMLLARMLGDVQAARVFVFDLLAAAERSSAAALPSVAAALDAWPECIPKRGKAPAAGSSSAADALHAILQQACISASGRSESAPDELADSSSRELMVPAARRLQALGSSVWSWHSTLQEGDGAQDPDAAVHAWAALRSAIAAA